MYADTEREAFFQNNRAELIGQIVDPPEFSHEFRGERFYAFSLEVPRLSGISDRLPVTAPQKAFPMGKVIGSGFVSVVGQIRSYNKVVEGKGRLDLQIYACEVWGEKEGTANSIVLNGYLCKPPVYRKTPFGREIADLLVAVNRPYNRSDYIPCIAWGRNARFSANLEVGTRVEIIGRMQSREYQKDRGEGVIENRVAYEVSVSDMIAERI